MPQSIKKMTASEKLQRLNAVTKNTLMETLGIVYTEVGEDYLVASMEVNSKVYQPMGLLHGGASVALAESVGSAASHLFVDPKAFIVKGIEITANHLKSKKSGTLTATATIIHKGKTTHLWKIEIKDEKGDMISFCKLTNIVLPKQ